jgi:putative ABC transport system ATP-binding protein/lipoprotein-releasing system ATP-binding protein
MTEEEIHDFRNTQVGFIFQFHYLLPELSAIENVLLPPRKIGRDVALQSRAKELLAQFGLAGKEGRLPSQLSGGEQQRVAIARSLIMNPKYIFADEPTGNLDTTNAMIVMNLLKQVNLEHKTTLVLVTHEPDFASMATRQIHLVDGHLAQP